MVKIKQYRHYFTIKKFLPLFLQLYPNKSASLIKKQLKNLSKNKDYKLLIAFIEGKPVAMVSVHSNFLLYVKNHLQVSSLYVEPQYRKMGVATLLLQQVEKLAFKQGCNHIILDSYLDNKSAHEIYIKEGFVAKSYNFVKNISND